MTKYLFIFVLFLLPQSVGATAYYTDFTNGLDTNNGLATTTAFNTINKFANNTRTAGDILFIRRNTATTTGIVATTFTTDGKLNNPITITADYDNLWNDFASTTQTYTLAFASTTMTASADQSDVVVGDWLYAQGDCVETYNSTTLNPCEFAYEVSAVASTSITFYLPYKGNQTGAGNNMRNMKKAPQVGTITQTVQIFTMSSDGFWIAKGLDLRSTNSTSVIQMSSNGSNLNAMDLVLQTNGVSAFMFSTPGTNLWSKIRSFGGPFFSSSAMSSMIMTNFLIDCNSVSGSHFISSSSFSSIADFINGEVKNCTRFLNDGSTVSASAEGGKFNLVNIKNNNVFNTISGKIIQTRVFEDNFSIVGLNSSSKQNVSSDTSATTTVSDTANLRAGGGPNNLHVRPPSGIQNTGISTKYFPYSYIKLFEYPIYANTSSKTYSMWFMSTSTTNFTTNPFTSTQTGSSTPEMYIECEYYNASSGADRKLLRSNTASAIDFNGSTAWQSISVTCQPTQTGILYLRGWYGKPNDGKSNWFFMDTQPVVS